MGQFWETASAIGLGIIGVAIVATLVSGKANTVGVIRATASGFGNDLGVALSPVTGNDYNIDLSYPASNATPMSGSAMTLMGIRN